MQTTKLYLTIITLCLCSIGAVAQPKDVAPAATSDATSASVTAPIQPIETVCPKCKERETNTENLQKAKEALEKTKEPLKKAQDAFQKAQELVAKIEKDKAKVDSLFKVAEKAKKEAEKRFNKASDEQTKANNQVLKAVEDKADEQTKTDAAAAKAQADAEFKKAQDAKTKAEEEFKKAEAVKNKANSQLLKAIGDRTSAEEQLRKAEKAKADAEEKVRIAESEVEIPIKKGELDALKADISQKEAQIKSQKEHIAALTQKNSNQSTEIEAQKQKIEELNGLVKEYNLYKKDVDFVDKQFATLANIRLSQKFNKEKIEDAKSCFEMMHGTKYNLPQLKVLINCYEQSYRDFQNILKEAQKDILRNSTYSPAFCDQYKNKYIAQIKGMSYYTKHYSANWTIEYLNAEINKALAILSKHSNDSIADFTELIDNDFK